MRLWLGGMVCLLLVLGTASAQEATSPQSPPTPAPEASPPPAAPMGSAPAAQPAAPAPAPGPTTPTAPTVPTEPAVPPSPPAEGPAAETPATETPAAAPTEEEGAAGPVVEILVIASGGMSAPLGTMSKIDSLRAAFKSAFRFLPGDVPVGLRVSGHRVGQDQPEQSCQDSELLVPPAPQGKANILERLDAITPQGNRSIAQSLSRAIVDLEKQSGPKAILLIAEGAEGCLEQDPATYLAASSLAVRGYTIHVRGLGLSEADSKQLAALADATGGTFANAEDPFALTQQLTIAIQKASGGEVKEPSPAPAAEGTTATEPATEEKPVPATPPPPETKPEPKEPPSVGPAPLPFDANKFRKELVADVLTNLPKPPKATPGKPAPTFSTLALIVIGALGLLLLLALAALVILIVKRPSSS